MQNSRFKQNFMINEAISILSKSGYHENQVVFHIRYFTQQFFALCDVILGIDNISFDNSM